MTYPNGPAPDLGFSNPSDAEYYALRLRRANETLLKGFTKPRWVHNAAQLSEAIESHRVDCDKAQKEIAWIQAKFPGLQPSRPREQCDDPVLRAIFG